ncbi:MAG: erythromycin esterase family protein, partial [Bacteroidales bacterium]|nr:erythromycin esterase family protein [Bacteroidales bacterium]
YELSVYKNDDWKLVIPPDKKIIGIGESIYGSKTMNHIEMELLKALVESNNCKLILFELDMYDVFLWNLYIQGIVGNNYLDKIKEYAVNNLLSEEEIVDFLVWLRKYNESKQKKVTIQGMVENNYNTLTNPLFDYVYAFYTDSSIQVIPQLLSYIHQGNISSAINLVRTSRELEELMGTSAFQDLLYGLLQMTRYTQDVEYSVNFHRKRSHDFSMYKNIEKFINQYTEKGETTALVAHASHVSKKGDISLFPNINSVGYYLKWKYGEQYHVIALHTGEGSFSTEATNQDPYLYSVKALTSPPNNSLEQECLKLQKPCFYYSTSSMNKENMFYRSIGNNYLENMEYQYNCFPVHFDGFIFVDKCEPVKTTDINSQTVVPDYRMERTNILKELHN